MPDEKTTKNKHLTYEERQDIQECLDKGVTFKSIGQRLGKAATTISREVKNHLSVKPLDITCTKSDGTEIDHKPCPLLLRAPFVCNPCKRRRSHCSFQKQLYIAKSAQHTYQTTLRESREGIPLNKEAFWEADAIIAEGMKKGQHLYHIMESNDIAFSLSSAYRHLHKGYLSASKMDFPRVVKFKARKPPSLDYIPKATKVGRTYEDFLVHLTEYNLSSWVEMDTVIGQIGGKAIMTFDFTFCNFMFGLLLENKTAAEVTKKIIELKQTFAKNTLRFGDVFPLLLTDNGGEFANVDAFETALNGEKETYIFFCQPMQSYQKPHVEKNHTLFRDIVPKGKSFDSFSQETVDCIFSHINSVKRKSLNGKTAYEMFSFLFGENVASLLGIYPVHAKDVVQSPRLLNESI